ncbi:HD-GYP domain-containing protein [Roseateles saccharophilus]|uniref:HD domain-containing protein n=1 Tax=Roseateles saccharophilus TaxID=304 RepID=A0A4R3ULJ5_ROSSA|nr:HD domain-containing phosphohydrolase [Roseateles saccharophilus]MDG0833847.1 HD domain-containing protein [Roseateles saccharophilus]TCU91527.1 HD domain-containing protein [Roseateles saccharophilus]
MTSDPPPEVNPHYLDHVIHVSASRPVEAAEDIVSQNGIKLLVKGSQIDSRVRERLLMHKLQKPLEDCVQVTQGVMPESFGPLGEALFKQHSLLQAICAHDLYPSAPTTLATLKLSVPVQSLLTIYAEYQGDRLRHTAGVAMLALALARRVLPGESERHRMLALAGMLHDVGELYIDPQYMRPGTPLGPAEWRHVASHPVVGERVLREMPGAGKEIASAVLHHHERLDGFGYPRGVQGAALPMNGQILAAAEWLMALIETSMTPMTRASVANRLIPGEFSREITEAITLAAQGDDSPAMAADPMPLESAIPRVVGIVSTLERFRHARPWIDQHIAAARPGLRAVLEAGLQRLLRIQTAFSSTGLDVHDPDALVASLAEQRDAKLQIELMTVVGELEWRLRELERESMLRAGLLPAAESAVMSELIDRLKGQLPVDG